MKRPLQAFAVASVFALAVAATLGPMPPAHAQTGQALASDPQGLATLMRDAGFRTLLTTDAQGDPRIISATSVVTFSVYFYGCTANENCQSIQFSAGFDLKEGMTADQLNDWNTSKRYAKTYLDAESDPYVQMDINLAHGGVSQMNMLYSLAIWNRLLSDFIRYVDWKTNSVGVQTTIKTEQTRPDRRPDPDGAK